MAATMKDLVKQFIKKDTERKKKEGDVEKIKEELARLQGVLMPMFEKAGVQSVKLTKGESVYIRRDVWAGAGDGGPVMLMEALKSVGLGDMVKEAVNTQTLSAWVREQEKEHFNGEKVTAEQLIAVLPEVVGAAIKVTEKYSLRSGRG